LVQSVSVRIPARFNGPAASGHGGYSAGLFASTLEGGGLPTWVTLRAPPPLETDLDVRASNDAVEIRLGETLIAQVAGGELTQPVPEPVTPDEAAAVTLDPEVLAEWHPFPTCFGCGPLREPGDGLRLFAGELADGSERWAADWTPDLQFADPDGTIPEIQVWAALDCPGGSPAGFEGGEPPIVLGRFCVEVEAPVRAGESHAIVSALTSVTGRKRATTIALYDAVGKRVARGESVWIALS
jgi:hypothetical protein